MKRPSLVGVPAAALACLLVVDCGLLYRRGQLRRKVAEGPEAGIWLPRPGAIPTRYLANGLRFGPAVGRARCFALMYTSATCRFCERQRPDWIRVVKRSRKLGCDAIRIAPVRDLGAADSGRGLGQEIVFIGSEWASGSPPTVTPTLMIFTRGAATSWCRVGELDVRSTAAALSALKAAAAPGSLDEAEREKGGRLVCR